MGGHSYSHHHHHHYGGGRINYSSGGGGGGCCRCSGKAILFGIFIFVVVLYVIIAAATFPKGNKKETTLSLSETRVMGVSSTWYDRISADTPIFKFNVSTYDRSTITDDVQLMRFKTRPLASVVDTWNVYEPSLTIGSYDHYYWSWYFFKGSSIQINWDFDNEITMYFIRSVKGYNSYYDEDGYYSSYTEGEVKARSGSRTYTVEKDDIYFVIFENWSDARYTARGNGTFSIASRLLNVTNPDEACVLPCGFDIPYGSSDTYVLYTPTVTSYVDAGEGSPNSEFTFKFQKSSRVWFVAVILFVVPISVMFLIMGLILCILFRKSISKSVSGGSSTPSYDPSANMTPMTTVGVSETMGSPYPPPVVYPVATATPYPAPYPAPAPYPVTAPGPHPDIYPPPGPAMYPPTMGEPIGAGPPPPTYPEPNAPPQTMYPPATAYTPAPMNYNAPPPVNPDYHPSYPPS